MAIIDAHVHVFPDEVICDPAACFEREACFELLYGQPGAEMATVGGLLEIMDADGIAASVVCAFPWRDPGRAREHNQLILQAGREHPGRLIPLAAVDPLVPGAQAEAERALAAGAAGLGEIGVYLDDLGSQAALDGLIPLAGLCAEADVPLLLHTNEPVGHTYPGKSPMSLRGLYSLVTACPDTRFQLAHLGGGIFLFELLRKQVSDVLHKCVFDTAAAPYLYRPLVYRLFAELAGPERLLYGSDYPLLRLARYLRDVDAADLPTAQRELLMGGNAVTFWGIDVQEWPEHDPRPQTGGVL
jgi:predicted TIM-barrel fold metal-dependent hydrolase